MSHEDLTKENNFWKLYAITRKIPDAKDNVVVFSISYFIFLLISFDGLDKTVEEIMNLKEVLKILLSTSVSVMGFILAGYAIFATLTDKVLQLEMSKHPEPITNLNYLKYSHAIFIRILIDLLLIAFLSLMFFAYLEMSVNDDFNLTQSILLSVVEPLIYAFFVLILMLCKSFIYNVYNSIMTSIRWYSENNDSE
jgi:hypothetical protein